MKTVVHPGIMLYDISWIPAVFFQAGTRKGQDSSMKWLDTLERKFDRFSIGNLMQYICLTMAALYIFAAIQPNVPIFSLIALSPYRIMQGQIWRLVTFIFMPPSSGSLPLSPSTSITGSDRTWNITGGRPASISITSSV